MHNLGCTSVYPAQQRAHDRNRPDPVVVPGSGRFFFSEASMIYDLYTMEMGDPPLERVYQLPNADAFKTVNAAVFYVLSRLYPGQKLIRDETDGAIVYTMAGHGWRMQLFILYTANSVATVRLHPLIPDNLAERFAWVNGPAGRDAGEWALRILNMCHSSIANLLRGAAFIIGAPAPPKQDLEAAIRWKDIYFPAMPDPNLAELVGAKHQTIKNLRSKLGMQKGGRGRSD
jgi:hypothetical protein